MAAYHTLKNVTITVDKAKVLNKLRANRENHAKIVAEARKGYIDKAKVVLAKRLDQLESGKLVSLAFHLMPPADFTSVYDVAITMFEMHTGETIELESTQIQNLVMDDWDWMTSFLGSNVGYSRAAREYAASKGVNLSDGADEEIGESLPR